ncbi:MULTISPECIES: GntR family transcriptional regulator [Streptomyces]|uniref:GntR family transcriptional regulator n=1 Tax=Streptomyces TaxID=1883 RepID=UPI00163BA974|nr:MULTISPECIES: GntR family transcriptional regulator [Streptomyces]MBC2877851.1 GntR family transcriptional regulator [Streptomyces sp. TYQ1024]UBI37988.1 GntR family transcriptional regulator [Streptomyces mobaraensis]UKW30575.1 GntR family transcriptional regulator [Streptomyces sp. TYQ1024]
MAKAYERIADDLRQSIRAGELAPGDRLPSEAKLAEHYRRSVPTVRDALRLLQAEGLIDKEHGRGNFVRRPRTLVQRSNLRHQWEKDRVREPEEKRAETGATEHDTGLELPDLEFHAAYREIPADKELAEAFGVSEGTTLLERTYRTRYRAESAPFTLVTSYLVRDMVAANPALLDAANEPWPGGTQNQLFTVGIELGRMEERVTARPPTAEEAEELDLPPGTAVLVLRKTSIDVDDRPVEISDVVLPGDRTEMLFTTPLERW